MACQKEEQMPSHSNELESSYGNVEMIKLESQLENPYTVQNMEKAWKNLTGLRYPGYVPPYFGIYTGLVPDLVDPADATGHDRVAGYTMKQIEDVLPTTSNFAEWENSLRSRYTNSTSDQLPVLFNFWLTFR